jgi:hypothetical protein
MARVRFGHCIGCDQPIRPSFLSFKVMWDHGDSITEWEEVDVCGECAGKLTAEDLHRLVSADEEQAA